MRGKKRGDHKPDWREGIVRTDDDHIRVRFGSDPTVVALVANIDGQITVQFLPSTTGEDTRRGSVLEQVRKKLDFYFGELGEKDPWRYAIYHCGTAANVYSKVHWGNYPKGCDD